MEQFEKIFFKYNCLNKRNNLKVNLDEIEAIIKFHLPNDYKIFLQNYLGLDISIGTEFLQLWNADKLIDTNKSYNIFHYLPNTLGIGSNGADELIAIDWIDKDNLNIVLTPFIELDRQYHVKIGTSFTDMLEQLDNGREWFT